MSTGMGLSLHARFATERNMNIFGIAVVAENLVIDRFSNACLPCVKGIEQTFN
jgi:hypothetical protein